MAEPPNNSAPPSSDEYNRFFWRKSGEPNSPNLTGNTSSPPSRGKTSEKTPRGTKFKSSPGPRTTGPRGTDIDNRSTGAIPAKVGVGKYSAGRNVSPTDGNVSDPMKLRARGTLPQNLAKTDQLVSNRMTTQNGTTSATVNKPEGVQIIPIKEFSTKNLRRLYELPDHAYQQMLAQPVPNGPFVATIAPQLRTANKTSIERQISPDDTTARNYFVWGENGSVVGWIPPESVPRGPSRSDDGNWWIWSDGREIQVAQRYPEDEKVVAADMTKQTSWEKNMGVRREPDKQDVRRRVDAGIEQNRDIEKYMTGGSIDPVSGKPLSPMSLEDARLKNRRDRKEVLEVMVVGAFQAIASAASLMDSSNWFEPPMRRGFSRIGTRVSNENEGPIRLSENGLEESAPRSGSASRPMGSSKGVKLRSRLDVLVVGAETNAEFAYAKQVNKQGGSAVVANPHLTDEALSFQKSGGNFFKGKVEDLPAGKHFDLIREDFPYPTGRVIQPAKELVESRMNRLNEGGTWVVVTEKSDFVKTLEVAAIDAGVNVSVNQIPAHHEATPQSIHPRDPNRYVLTFSK